MKTRIVPKDSSSYPYKVQYKEYGFFKRWEYYSTHEKIEEAVQAAKNLSKNNLPRYFENGEEVSK